MTQNIAEAADAPPRRGGASSSAWPGNFRAASLMISSACKTA